MSDEMTSVRMRIYSPDEDGAVLDIPPTTTIVEARTHGSENPYLYVILPPLEPHIAEVVGTAAVKAATAAGWGWAAAYKVETDEDLPAVDLGNIP